MAVVNHSGSFSADEIWLSNDEHHITDAMYFSGAVPYDATIQPGVTVYFDSRLSLGYADADNVPGRFVVLGKENNKVIWQGDPALAPLTYGDPHPYGWGPWCGGSLNTRIDWLELRHIGSIMGMYIPNENAKFKLRHVKAVGPDFMFHIAAQTPGLNNYDSIIDIDGVYLESMSFACTSATEPPDGAIALIKSGVDMTSSPTITNIAMGEVYQGFGTPGVSTINHIHNASNVKFIFKNFMFGGTYWKPFLLTAAMTGNGGFDLTLKRFFPAGGEAYAIAAGTSWMGNGLTKVCNSGYTFKMLAPLNVYDSVFYNLPYGGMMIHGWNVADDALNVENVDFIDNNYLALYWDTRGPSSFNVNKIYAAGNYGLIDTVATFGTDGTGAPREITPQWYDANTNAGDRKGPIGVQSTPIFPLDVESVRVDHINDSTAVVSFSAKEGPTSTEGSPKRMQGVPFVKFGEKSGELNQEAGPRPKSKEELLEVFGKWRTDLGFFDTTCHEVTLIGLEPSKTYYFKPCFIDPLMRIGEGSESSFTTDTITGFVSQAVYDSTYNDMQRLKILYVDASQYYPRAPDGTREIKDIQVRIEKTLAHAPLINGVYRTRQQVTEPYDANGDCNYPIAVVMYNGPGDETPAGKGAYDREHNWKILIFTLRDSGQRQTDIELIRDCMSSVIETFRKNDTLSGQVMWSEITGGEGIVETYEENRVPLFAADLDMVTTSQIKT